MNIIQPEKPRPNAKNKSPTYADLNYGVSITKTNGAIIIKSLINNQQLKKTGKIYHTHTQTEY